MNLEPWNASAILGLAREQLAYVPASEHRPARAIAAVEAFRRGEAGIGEVRRAARGAHDAHLKYARRANRAKRGLAYDTNVHASRGAFFAYKAAWLVCLSYPEDDPIDVVLAWLRRLMSVRSAWAIAWFALVVASAVEAVVGGVSALGALGLIAGVGWATAAVASELRAPRG